jgi:phage tail sheath protein FI
MREGLTAGIRVAEQAGGDQAIARAQTAITAFVGRTLRGPVDRPVTIHSFAEFQATFGGLWQPSTLSYAVEQYFENGGRTAIVVRVANGGRPATLTLPAGRTPMVLEALCPGTREFLRAAVDYDNVGPADPDKFNLVVQRVRAPGSEHVEDQEIFRKLSVDPESPRYVAQVLTESTLVRLRSDAPVERPWPTQRADARALAGYVNSNPDGDDGGPLTDYDVIGSATKRTGLFALGEVESFNFLCVPPLTREQPVGPSALLVAARYCRERRAIFVVDPPAQWTSAADAVAGIRDHAFASENAVMYFPWVLAYDRLRGRFEPFAPCGAAAGMLARVGEANPVWSPGEIEEGPLRPGLRPAVQVDEGWRARLANAGVNTLLAVRPRHALGARTLAGPMASAPDWKWLGQRRLALFLVDSLERGTRWALFEPNGPTLWRRLEEQVSEFLDALERDGAFPGRPRGQAWFVICDERLNPADATEVRFLFGAAALREGEYHCWLVSHGSAGSRAQGVTLNRLQSAGGRPPLDPELDVQTMLAEALRR